MRLVSPFTHNRLANPLSPVPSLHNGLCVRVDKSGTKFPSLSAELAEIDFFSCTALIEGFLFLTNFLSKNRNFLISTEEPFFCVMFDQLETLLGFSSIFQLPMSASV